MNAYQEFRVIGSRPIRPDGLDKVTGRARYGADLNMQGQIYGHVVRSPHAHAVIQSIDCSKALAMEGVLAVMTGDDLVKPGNEMLGSGEGAMALKEFVPMVMSQGKVLFHSQAVAAVAAISPELAAEAARVVEVTYEVLPAVTDLHKALAPDAPILHHDRFPDDYPEEPTNLATHISLTVGEPDAAFEKADVVVEQTLPRLQAFVAALLVCGLGAGWRAPALERACSRVWMAHSRRCCSMAGDCFARRVTASLSNMCISESTVVQR